MPRRRARRATPGATICPGPSPSAVGDRRGRRSPASFIRLRRAACDQRPAEADDRATPGHWEADLDAASGNRGQEQAADPHHERYSRLMLALPLTSKEAEPTAQASGPDARSRSRRSGRRTVTFDNGTEFARHYQLHRLGAQDLLLQYSLPLAEGSSVENGIGRLRRFLPRTSQT